jgi:cyanophycin synthetase
VLNADDPLVLRMSGYTDAKNFCYVTLNPQHQLVREHIRAGGRACALEAGVNGSMITLYDRGGHIPLVWTHLIPATLEGRALHNVQNAMFAAAMAFSLGIKLDAIRQGLRTFDSTFFQAPGRMNVYDELPFKVLFDYGHNAHAVSAMADLAQRLDVTGRRIVVLAGPGDRRDEDLVAIANAVAGRFDHYICRRDDSLRDREPDEVPRIQAAALRAAGVKDAAITIIPDEQEAIDAALHMGKSGDLLLIFADALGRSWKQITKFRPAGAPSASTLPEGDSLVVQPLSSDSGQPPGQRSALRGGTAEGLVDAPAPALNLEGLIRDERGVRFAPETED